MIKYYRINHEGFHRIGIVLGVISLIISPWILLYSLGFNYSFSFADIVESHFELVDEIVRGIPQIIFIFVIYILFYFIGYSIPKILNWLIKGFNER